VARTFDHHLHVVFPSFLGEFAEHFEFGELCFVACIRNASRPQAIAERKTHVMLLENLADVFEPLVQEILLLVVLHPVRH